MPQLTRDEWCKMWESIKTIESMLPMMTGGVSRIVNIEIVRIKNQIQLIVGQME